MTSKYGLAHEKHEHLPPSPPVEDFGCGAVFRQSCGKEKVCCHFCDIFYRCQEGRCTIALFSGKFQPNPQPFDCPKKKSVCELAWELLFQHGSEYY